MRTASLIAGTVLVCGLAFAGRNENVVYTEGNLTGIDLNANAVLDLSSDTAMKLRVGRTDVSVPYASITKSETAADSTFVPPPGKKPKPMQLLRVEFTSVQGEPRSMILELSRSGAAHVANAIHKHAPLLAQATPATTDAAADSSKKLEARNQEPQETTPAPPPAPAPVAEPSPAAPVVSVDAQAPTATPANPEASATAAAAPATSETSATAAAPADQQDQSAKPEKATKAKKNKKNKKNEEVAANDKADSKKPEWWGDSVWKTTRNAAKWEQIEKQQQQGSTAAAQ